MSVYEHVVSQNGLIVYEQPELSTACVIRHIPLRFLLLLSIYAARGAGASQSQNKNRME